MCDNTQDEVAELRRRVGIQDDQLRKCDELNQEALELRVRAWLLAEELRIKTAQLQAVEDQLRDLVFENTSLREELRRLTEVAFLLACVVG